MRRTLAFLLIAVLTAGSRALAQGSGAPPPALSLAAAVNEALVKNERIVNQSDAIAQAGLPIPATRILRNDADAATAVARAGAHHGRKRDLRERHHHRDRRRRDVWPHAFVGAGAGRVFQVRP